MPNPVPGSKLTSIPREVIARVSTSLRGLFTPGSQAEPPSLLTVSPSVQPPTSGYTNNGDNRRDPWFGPGTSMRPVAPREDVVGRAFDYSNSYNIGTQVRQEEVISFDHLKMLADNCNQVRLAIETVKDQMSGLTWGIKPRMSATDDLRATPDARCQEIESFLKCPDQRVPWDQWQRMLMEQMLVLDAPSVFIRRTVGGKPYSFDVVDGATVRPLLDKTGRGPMPPAVAFQQVLKGMPAVDYTSNEMIYMPRNPRVGRVYGHSPVEQLIFTINIVLRRDAQKLLYYTAGNIPEALMGVPETWTPEQIARFQVIWDTLNASQENKAGVRFVPGGMNFQATRSDASLMGEVDEWFARLICYCFSLPEQPFVKQVNRATAEQANATALDQGMRPRMIWFKGLMDRLIRLGWGFDDIEFVWDDIEDIDPGELATRQLAEVQYGLVSIDEVRAQRGMPKLGMGPAIWGPGPLGFMFVEDILQARAAGLMMPQAPAQIDPATGQPIQAQPGALPPGAAPSALGGPPMLGAQPGVAPGAGDPGADSLPLQGIPLSLLAAVGLGPDGNATRQIDVTAADEFQSDPAAAHVGHPKVLATLREFERAHRKSGA